jgi:D-alanyl-D-alanine carboxypeptidase (penicillin-binding protein 5/6)
MSLKFPFLQVPEGNDIEPREKLPVLQQLALLAVILLLIFGSALPSTFLLSRQKDDTKTTTTQTARTFVTPTADVTSPAFSNITVTAQAAYVWDAANQRALYKKNESEQLPLASLTKLMTALLAEELLDEKDRVTVNQTAVNQDGFSGLSIGETFDRLALSDLTLISSSNDGAYALASAAGSLLTTADPANAFVQAMNIRAKEIGLTQSYFKNPTGLDISSTEGGAYGTARDMAFLMEYILENEPDILSFTTMEEADIDNAIGLTHEAENTNYFVSQIPGLIGSKTGYTDLAGGNLVIAFEAGLNRPIIAVVLGSTRQERFSDIMSLVEQTQIFINQES